MPIAEQVFADGQSAFPFENVLALQAPRCNPSTDFFCWVARAVGLLDETRVNLLPGLLDGGVKPTAGASDGRGPADIDVDEAAFWAAGDRHTDKHGVKERGGTLQCFEKLVVPISAWSRVTPTDPLKPRTRQAFRARLWAMMDKTLPRPPPQGAFPSQPAGASRKQNLLLYGHNGGRHIRTWNDVTSVADAFGPYYNMLRVTDFGALSFLAQARLFRDADVLAMAHGAQMANTLFCRPGTAIVELSCTGCVCLFGLASLLLLSLLTLTNRMAASFLPRCTADTRYTHMQGNYIRDLGLLHAHPSTMGHTGEGKAALMSCEGEGSNVPILGCDSCEGDMYRNFTFSPRALAMQLRAMGVAAERELISSTTADAIQAWVPPPPIPKDQQGDKVMAEAKDDGGSEGEASSGYLSGVRQGGAATKRAVAAVGPLGYVDVVIHDGRVSAAEAAAEAMAALSAMEVRVGCPARLRMFMHGRVSVALLTCRRWLSFCSR